MNRPTPGAEATEGRGPEVRLVRLGSERGLGRPLGVVAGLLALAIAKPWAWGQPPESPAPRLPAAAVKASPVDVPSPLPTDPVAAICHESPSWRVASIGEFVGARLREWAFVTPVAAAGPSDPAIPFAVFGFTEVEALGYCAPSHEPPGSNLSVGVYLLGGDGTETSVRITRLERTPASSIAGLFERGPSSPSGWPGPNDTAGWQPGRYVFSLRAPPTDARWFGVVLLARPGNGV